MTWTTKTNRQRRAFFAFLASGPLAAAALVYFPALPVALVALCYGIVGLWTLGLAFIVALLAVPPLAEKVMTARAAKPSADDQPNTFHQEHP